MALSDWNVRAFNSALYEYLGLFLFLLALNGPGKNQELGIGLYSLYYVIHGMPNS
jgi:hypothetical protein